MGTGQASVASDALGPQSLSGQEVCANSVLRVFSRNDFGETTDFTWTATTGSFISSQTDAYAELLTPGPGQNIDVAVRFQDDCGTYKVAHAFFYTVGQMSDGSYCQGVIQPRSAAPVVVYPNPANDALIIEQASGTVTLRNNQGEAMFQGKPQQGKLMVDTRSLPEGLYYLEHKRENDKGKALRRQISIKH